MLFNCDSRVFRVIVGGILLLAVIAFQFEFQYEFKSSNVIPWAALTSLKSNLFSHQTTVVECDPVLPKEYEEEDYWICPRDHPVDPYGVANFVNFTISLESYPSYQYVIFEVNVNRKHGWISFFIVSFQPVYKDQQRPYEPIEADQISKLIKQGMGCEYHDDGGQLIPNSFRYAKRLAHLEWRYFQLGCLFDPNTAPPKGITIKFRPNLEVQSTLDSNTLASIQSISSYFRICSVFLPLVHFSAFIKPVFDGPHDLELIEFINHHRKLGVDHFYIHDRYGFLVDPLKPYVDTGIVTLIRFPQSFPKMYRYQDHVVTNMITMHRANKHATWVLQQDMDELLSLQRIKVRNRHCSGANYLCRSALQEFTRDYQDAGSISWEVWLFHDNDIPIDRPEYYRNNYSNNPISAKRVYKKGKPFGTSFKYTYQTTGMYRPDTHGGDHRMTGVFLTPDIVFANHYKGTLENNKEANYEDDFWKEALLDLTVANITEFVDLVPFPTIYERRPNIFMTDQQWKDAICNQTRQST